MKIFKGMMRPDLSKFTSGGYILCSCGQILTHLEITRDHWALDHFDYPIHEEIPDGSDFENRIKKIEIQIQSLEIRIKNLELF